MWKTGLNVYMSCRKWLLKHNTKRANHKRKGQYMHPVMLKLKTSNDKRQSEKKNSNQWKIFAMYIIYIMCMHYKYILYICIHINTYIIYIICIVYIYKVEICIIFRIYKEVLQSKHKLSNRKMSKRYEQEIYDGGNSKASKWKDMQFTSNKENVNYIQNKISFHLHHNG